MTRLKYPTTGTKITSEILPWLLNYNQVAEVLGVARRTVEGYAADGKFPIVDLGHRTKRVHYRDLEVYVNRRREIDDVMARFYKAELGKDDKQTKKFVREPDNR